MWQLGLISSTVYHMGAAVLPFRTRLLAVLDALFQAPSKARARAHLSRRACELLDLGLHGPCTFRHHVCVSSLLARLCQHTGLHGPCAA